MLPVILRGAFGDISGYGSFCRYIARALHSAGVRPAIHDLRCEKFSPYAPSSSQERAVLDELRSIKPPDPGEALVFDATSPELFNHCFKADVGYSMIECTQISALWAFNCLKMDATFVPGPFCKSAFERSGILKVTEVAPGFDTKTYQWVPEDRFGVWDGIGPEPFKFIVTGHLMQSEQDRKGIKQLIRCWAREFLNDPDVGLALKAQVYGHDFVDRLELTGIICDLLKMEGAPQMTGRISVLHRNYTSAELATIYSHPSIRAFVSPSSGEGIGYNMLECASCGGVPIIATNFSEHVNLLPSNLLVGLPFTLVPIPDEYSIIPDSPFPKEASWASVSDDDLMAAMRSFYETESAHPRKPVTGEIMPGLSLEAFGDRLARALEAVVPGSRRKEASERIQVGSGINPISGWIHIEENGMKSRGVDISCDPKRVPLADGTVGEAMVYGILDGMNDEDAARAVYECFRMLKPGGAVHLVVTDSGKIMRNIIFNGAKLPPHLFAYLMRLLTENANLWTRRRLLKLLSRVGFNGAKMEGRNSQGMTSDEVAGQLAGKKFRVSMVARAVKPA